MSMRSLAQFIHEVESYCVELYVENDDLKVVRVNRLPLDLVPQLESRKQEILELFRMDRLARSAGFLTLTSGVAYERQLGVSSHLILIKESDLWSAWQQTWIKTRNYGFISSNNRNIAINTTFDRALKKVIKYLINSYQK